MAEHENSIGQSDEWFTPRSIFNALQLTFDLDVAHPGLDHPHCCVPAKQVYTERDDGLAQPWFGLIFCNPPYGGRGAHVPWLERFIDHGNGVGVFRAYTSSDWWHQWMPSVELIVFPKGKTKFVRPNGSIGASPGHGTAVLGMGDVACAALLSSGLGMVWDRRQTRALGTQSGHSVELAPDRCTVSQPAQRDGRWP